MVFPNLILVLIFAHFGIVSFKKSNLNLVKKYYLTEKLAQSKLFDSIQYDFRSPIANFRFCQVFQQVIQSLIKLCML